MAVTYFFKDQRFHYSACNDGATNSTTQPEDTLSAPESFIIFAGFQCSGIHMYFNFFLFLMSIFILYCFGVKGDISGSLKFNCPSLWIYMTRDILLIAIFQVPLLSETHLKYCCCFKPSWKINTTQSLFKFPHFCAPPEWEGKENECKTCMLRKNQFHN